MKTSEKAKLAGLKNLAELSKMTKVTTEAFRSWDGNRSELFEIVLLGAVEKKNGGFQQLYKDRRVLVEALIIAIDNLDCSDDSSDLEGSLKEIVSRFIDIN